MKKTILLIFYIISTVVGQRWCCPPKHKLYGIKLESFTISFHWRLLSALLYNMNEIPFLLILTFALQEIRG